MLTSLEPEYKFTDGVATAVGEYESIVKGSIIKVYVPTMMTEIECTPLKETPFPIEGLGNTAFLNENHPDFPEVVVGTNVVKAKVTEDMIVRLSNIELHKTDGFHGEPIKYIPRHVPLHAGEELTIESDLGIFKDFELY